MSQEQSSVIIDTSLGYLLKQTHSVLRSAMDGALRPLGLTVSQYACLELLAQRPGLSNSELARGTFVSRQSMNVMLQSMERDGLVTRPEQAAAGRILPTQLTALGHERLHSASAAAHAVDAKMGSGLSAAEHEQLRRLLGSCITALAGA